MGVPQPFPYQGSKRKIAATIVSFLPTEIDTLIEPFCGSAAISIAAAYANKAARFLLNDINAPLMALWDRIITSPGSLALQYETLWHDQQGREKEYYFQIRDEFNRTCQPQHLLYLLARCVKAAVRYNANGEFNQSADNRRKGMHPRTMRKNIAATSALFREKTALSTLDYRDVLAQVGPADVVYMDPPYQGVCLKQDPRYFQSLSFDAFTETLSDLNTRNISYLVSYDGRTGSKTHGKLLPESLNLKHLEIDAGRSTQETLLGRTRTTYESLYISHALWSRLETRPAKLYQLVLWA